MLVNSSHCRVPSRNFRRCNGIQYRLIGEHRDLVPVGLAGKNQIETVDLSRRVDVRRGKYDVGVIRLSENQLSIRGSYDTLQITAGTVSATRSAG